MCYGASGKEFHYILMKIKINSMDTESTPSDDEIRSFMNFDKMVEEARKRSGKRKPKKYWIIAPLALALFSVWYIVDRTSTNINSHADKPQANFDQQVEPTPGIKTDSVVANTPDGSGKQSHDPGKKDVPSVVPLSKDQSSSGARKELTQPSVVKDESSIQGDVYVQAEPQQGYAHLYAYFSKNLTYPKEALKDSIEGVEVVSFTIDEEGKPANISVTQSLGKAFDQEAIRLIREMPLWIPAMLNDRPVASQLSLPLTFEVKRIKKQ